MKRLIGLSALTIFLFLTSCKEESNEVKADLDEAAEINLNSGVGVISPEKYTIKVVTSIDFEGHTGTFKNRNFTVTLRCPDEAYKNEYSTDRNNGLAGTYISNEEGSFEFKLPVNTYCISSRFTFDLSGVIQSPPICIQNQAFYLESYVYADSDKTIEIGNESLKLLGECPIHP